MANRHGRVAASAATLGLGVALLAPAPAQAVACDRTWNNTPTLWEVRYECNRSAFDGNGMRRVKNSKGFYPAVIRGKAGPSQTFRLKVAPPDYHGVRDFTGRIGGKRVSRGFVDIVTIPRGYVVSSGMTLDGQRIACEIKGKPDGAGWSEVDPHRKTRPACLASTILMFDLVLGPWLEHHEPHPIEGLLR